MPLDAVHLERRQELAIRKLRQACVLAAYADEGLDVVGIVEVCGLAHQDTTTDDPRWECVDVRAVKDVPNPPTLDQIKANEKLSKMVLVVNSRLSVQPVTPDEWKEVCRMGGLVPAP